MATFQAKVIKKNKKFKSDLPYLDFQTMLLETHLFFFGLTQWTVAITVDNSHWGYFILGRIQFLTGSQVDQVSPFLYPRLQAGAYLHVTHVCLFV